MYKMAAKDGRYTHTTSKMSIILRLAFLTKTFSSSQGDPDEIAHKYQEKKMAYIRIKKEVGQMKRFCQVGLNAEFTHSPTSSRGFSFRIYFIIKWH